jgi:hypothetical protein
LYSLSKHTQAQLRKHRLVLFLFLSFLLGIPSGTRPFRLDMPTVAKIFTGQIKNWRDPEMIRLNPEISEYLPDANMSVSEHDTLHKLSLSRRVCLRRGVAAVVTALFYLTIHSFVS